MVWLKGYAGEKIEFLLDPEDIDKGFSSLQYPWEITIGNIFSIDTSYIENKELTKQHLKVIIIITLIHFQLMTFKI